MKDALVIIKKYNDNPLWCCDTQHGGIGGSHFFKWMEANNIEYRSNFYEVWYHYTKEFPEYNTEDFEIMGTEIHYHYYECGILK